MKFPANTPVQVTNSDSIRAWFHGAKAVVLQQVETLPMVDPDNELCTIELYQEEYDRLRALHPSIPRQLLMFVSELQEIPDLGLTQMQKSITVTRKVRATYRDALGQVQGVAYDEPVVTTGSAPSTLSRQVEYTLSVLENLIPAAEEGLRNAQSDASDGVEGAHITAFEYMSALREAAYLVEQLKKGETPMPLELQPNEAE